MRLIHNDLYDPHNKKRVFENQLAIFNKNKTLNKDLILKFIDEWSVEANRGKGCTPGRLARYLRYLEIVDRQIKKPFDQLTKEDIKSFVYWSRKTFVDKPNKDRDLRVCLKVFFGNWLKKKELVADFSTNYNGNKTFDVLTDLEAEKLRKTAELTCSLRNATIVNILLESGLRASELLTLKLKKIRSDQYGFILDVEGKTGHRSVRTINSSSLINRLLSNHPRATDPEAYLICSKKGEPICYRELYKLIRIIAVKSGIKKRVSPHSLRHYAATRLAKHLRDQELKKYFGWTPASKQASTYIHLSSVDLDDSLLRANGMVPQKESKPAMNPIECPRCNYKLNPAGSVACEKCNGPLSVEAAIKFEEDAEKKLEELVDRIIANKFPKGVVNNEKQRANIKTS